MVGRSTVNSVFGGAGRRCAPFWLLFVASLCMAPAVDAQATGGAAVTISETGDLADAVEAAKAARLDSQGRVLLVLDIDNTLLTMPQYLGGDRWFNQHASQIANGNDPDFGNFDELIAVQSALFGLASMNLTQPDAPSLLVDAIKAGIDIALLSARGPDLYDATRRELDRNGLRFPSAYACAFFLCASDGLFDDDRIRGALAAIGEAPSDTPYRKILIRDGIMLVGGQDKGVMLKLLMGAIGGRNYAHVVVADDARKNIDALAASRPPVPLSLFHYRRIKTRVTNAEDRDARARLRQLRSVLCPAVETSFCPEQGVAKDREKR